MDKTLSYSILLNRPQEIGYLLLQAIPQAKEPLPSPTLPLAEKQSTSKYAWATNPLPHHWGNNSTFTPWRQATWVTLLHTKAQSTEHTFQHLGRLQANSKSRENFHKIYNQTTKCKTWPVNLVFYARYLVGLIQVARSWSILIRPVLVGSLLQCCGFGHWAYSPLSCFGRP